jgi:hypothetical protein
MKITAGAWGMGVAIMGLVIHLYWGDVYIRLPWVGELAWNSTGLHMNRIKPGSPVPREFRE